MLLFSPAEVNKKLKAHFPRHLKMALDFNDDNAFSPTTYQVIASVYLLIGSVSFLLNSMVLLAFMVNRSLLLPGNLFVVSIAASDWLMSVVANPMGFAANISRAWAFGKSTCTFYAFVTTFLGLGCMLLHTAFAVDRYIAVSRPMKVSLTVKHVLLLIGSLWIFSLFWSVCPLLGWSAYAPEAGNIACSIRWQSSFPTDTSFNICLFVFFYFVPIIVIVTCYTLMFMNLRHMTKNAQRIWGTNAAATLETVMASCKLAKISLVMVVGFFFAWTPYTIVSLYSAFGDPDNISTLLAAVPSLFAKTATMYNPIVYFFSYKTFRESLLKLIRRHRNRDLVRPLTRASATGFVVPSRVVSQPT